MSGNTQPLPIVAPYVDEEYTFPERIMLSPEAFDEFQRMLNDPPPPNAALIELFKR